MPIQPSSRPPSAAIARALSSAWLRQPSRRPTTRITGSSHAFANAEAIKPGASGTSQPPTPSTTTGAWCARSRSNASVSGGNATVTPSRAAAKCGDSGARRLTGLIAA
ncbi:MAG: hypothetical protein ABT19_12860 [Rhodanobacter sp. SCN 68-63]|nr:MAG: hypothetical protein ABT19_12860 [Rhodanobacter sp. SCN 68-63]